MTAGIAIERLGTTSVVYRLALFGAASEVPAAVRRFVHVYVDRDSRRPIPVPSVVRDALERTVTSLPGRCPVQLTT